MDDCFICSKHKGIIETSGITIYEDEFVFVGHIDQKEQPHYLGHLMIDLKRHAPTLGHMTSEEAKAFGVAIARVSKALLESENAEHIYSYVAGNALPHLHLHLVPRYPNTPQQFWGPMAVYDWEKAPFGDTDAVKKLCQRIKFYLETETTNV
ncbi:HIT family protein [Alkalihalobacillus sp. 1P02AB]|uniref:HIT family protein n=1 Tax=Alkalihalobacillus sp. 1P02AB TaxID=3132260 RepID=UPI0039A6E59F